MKPVTHAAKRQEVFKKPHEKTLAHSLPSERLSHEELRKILPRLITPSETLIREGRDER